MLGDQFYLVALPWLVLGLTGSSLALGTLLMIAALPRTAFLLIGGALTDRMSPRRILLAAAAVRMLLVSGLALLVWFDALKLWQLVALTIAFGIADAFSFPAAPALLPSLVPPQQLGPANALLQSTMVVSQMVGPAPAGLLIRSFSVLPALVIDAISFLAVIAALFRLPEPPPRPASPQGAPSRPSFFQAIGAGLHTVRQDRALVGLISLFAALNLCIAGPIGVGLASVANFRFGTATALGVLLSSFFAGSLVGLLIAGSMKQPRRRGFQFLVIAGTSSLALAGLGTTEAIIPSASLLSVIGCGVSLINVQFTAWIQRRVELPLLGRVMSVVMLFAVGLMPLSYLLAGLLAEWSLPALFFTAGAVLATATLAVALFGHAARAVD